MKLKRILAWMIDWFLCGTPALIYALIFSSFLSSQQKIGAVAVIGILLFPFFVLSFPMLFVLRDALFKGRSIAKRILKLSIIDVETNELPSRSKLIQRNLFFFIYPIDALVLLIKNRSIGDMITKTTVIKEKQLEKI